MAINLKQYRNPATFHSGSFRKRSILKESLQFLSQRLLQFKLPNRCCCSVLPLVQILFSFVSHSLSYNAIPNYKGIKIEFESRVKDPIMPKEKMYALLEGPKTLY